MYVETLTPEIVTNLFLYGQTTTPEKESAGLIRADNITVSVDVSESAFMLGAGRFAMGSRSPLVEHFFDGGTPIAPGNYSLSDVSTMFGTTGDFTTTQILYGDGTADYAERAWIYNHTDFHIDADARFIVEANGDRHIAHFAMRPEADNFDFVSTGITSILNVAASFLTDPSGIGRQVLINFIGTPTYVDYTQLDFAADEVKEPIYAAGATLGPLEFPGLFNGLDSSGVTHFVSSDGLAISYGSDNLDVIDAGDLAEHPYLNTAAAAGRVVFLGAGDDAFLGNLGTTFRVDGGDDYDLADFSGNTNGVSATVIRVEEVQGSDQDDTLTLGDAPGAFVFDGGEGVDTLSLENLTSGLTATFQTGSQPISGWTLSNLEGFVGTQGNDTLTIVSGIEKVGGGAGDDHIEVTGSQPVELTGGAGDDTLIGGSDIDTFVYRGDTNGFDVIDGGGGIFDEIVAAEPGTVVGLSSMVGIGKVTALPGSDALVQFDEGDNVLDLSTVAVTGTVSFYGAGGNDVLTGSSNVATDYTFLEGGEGDDTLVAGTQPTFFYGGPGNDTIVLGLGASAEEYDGADTFVVPLATGLSAGTVTATIDGVDVDYSEMAANTPSVIAHWYEDDALQIGESTITTLNVQKSWNQFVTGGSHEGEHLISIGETNADYDFIMDAYIDPNDGMAHVLFSFTSDSSAAWLDDLLDLQGIVDAAQQNVVATVRFDGAYWQGLGLTVTGDVAYEDDLYEISLYGPSNYNDALV